MARYIDAKHLIQKINDNEQLSKWAKGIAMACVMDTPVVDLKEKFLEELSSPRDSYVYMVEKNGDA